MEKQISEFIERFDKEREECTQSLLNNIEEIVRKVVTDLIISKKKVSPDNNKERQKCSEKTLKGDPCKKYAVQDGMCKQHYDKCNVVSDDVSSTSSASVKKPAKKTSKPKPRPKKIEAISEEDLSEESLSDANIDGF